MVINVSLRFYIYSNFTSSFDNNANKINQNSKPRALEIKIKAQPNKKTHSIQNPFALPTQHSQHGEAENKPISPSTSSPFKFNEI